MKPVAVVKKGRGAHLRRRTRLHLEKGIEKPKQDYEKHLGRVLSQGQQTTSQNYWALDLLNRGHIGSDGFQLMAAEAARLSHYKPRNTITGHEICSALRELYLARHKAQTVSNVPCSPPVTDQS